MPRVPKKLDATGLREYAMKTLAGRSLSAGEMRTRLRRRAENPDDIDGVIAKLREYGFINDAQLAESFTAARKETRGFGRQRVLRDLATRRVAPSVARAAVEQAYAGTDETQMIEQYLERKYRGRHLPELLQEDKNLASAYRRLRVAGFSSGASIRVLKRYAARADELEGTEEEAG
jgi:regulatory protein